MGRAGAAAAPTSLGPRPRWPPEAHHRRDIIDAIGYVAHNGCVWRALPCDFPPWRTVYGFSWRWNANGATTRLHDQFKQTGLTIKKVAEKLGFPENAGEGIWHRISLIYRAETDRVGIARPGRRPAKEAAKK